MQRLRFLPLFMILVMGSSLFAQVIEAGGERERRGLRHLKNRLSRQIISVDWEEEVSLRDALRHLRLRSGVRLVIGTALFRDELGDESVHLKLRNIAVWDLLTLLGERYDLGFRMRGRLLVVSTKADTIRRSMKLQVYDAGLVGYRPPDFPGPRLGLRPSNVEDERAEVAVREGPDREEIVELIKRMTGAKNWEIEGADISFSTGGLLIVRHAPSMQRRVARILRMLE
jgi:hypothetical protein